MLSSLSISSASTYTQKHIQPKDVGILCDKELSVAAAHSLCFRRVMKRHNHLLEVSIFPLLPVHHVVKNWDHNVSNLGLRHQGDTEEGTHHSRDEVGLVVTCSTEIQVKLS